MRRLRPGFRSDRRPQRILAKRATAGVVLAVGIVLGACGDAIPVSTYRVVRRDFTHRVLAEGFLGAEDATQVIVPGEVRHGGRILWMGEDGTEVEEGQVVMRLDHYDLEQRLEEELAELQSADVERRRTATVGRSAVDTATTRKDLAGLELDHAERFRRDDDAVFSLTDIVESQIDEEIARTRRGRAAQLEGIQGDRARAQLELVDVERRMAGLEVDLARAALASLELRAPKRGLLVWERDWRGETPRIGEQVFRRQVIAEIPDLDSLEAEVFVLEADAGGVDKGQPAEVTIDAHPERVYRARVARVDPIAKRRFRGSPVQYVAVRLSLENVDLEIMKPGQRVTVSILINDEPAGLVVPRPALFLEEGSYYVYQVAGGGFTKREVDVRAIAPGLALLEEGLDDGLEEGALVALEEPSARTLAETSPRRAVAGSPTSG